MSESNENKQNGSESERKEKIRLDETVKLLFEVSNKTLVKTLNALFHENHNAESIIIEKTATEYPNNDLDMIRADMFICITEHKPYHYHIEIQTEPHNQMAVRMMEYDMMKAVDNYRLSDKKETVPNLFMPKSVIIQIENGGGVPKNHYELNLTLADGQTVTFKFPVMRYFDYDDKRLIKENLYLLLPLQVFLIRKELDSAQKILHKIMIALSECFQHLNNRYQVQEKLNTEVDTMVRSYLNTEAIEQAKKKASINKAAEIAKKMLKIGLSFTQIAETTELDLDTIKELKNQSEQETEE